MSKIQFLGLFLLVMLALPAAAPAQVGVGVGISVHIGPPALPVYVQPICPAPGYLWTPGYWAYGPDGYYWVPGTWVLAPAVGVLWTPGYWGWGGGGYFWHTGYWGPHVGFYGGINYGFGYGGVGYVGGAWNHGVFGYNTAVTNVNTTVIHNTYVNRTVINNTTVNNVSYNGGTGGVTAQPTAGEKAAMNEPHTPATALQTQHEHAASTNKALLASVNHGKPAIAATAKPGEFTGKGVVPATAASHAANVQKTDRPPSAQTGNKPSNTTHTNTGAVSSNHPNTATVKNNHPNNTSNPPKNQPHTENKPHTETKPHESGGKPH